RRAGGRAPARGIRGHGQGEPPGQGRGRRQPDRPSLRRGRPRERRRGHLAGDPRGGDCRPARRGGRGPRREGLLTRHPRSGILPVEKGPGVTSFQVVAHLRRVLRAPKVGHGGTLDPEATGVLPILIGEATKLTPYLVDLDKEYVATVRLGVVTDTQDLGGAVVDTRPVPDLGPGEIEAALR